MSLFLKFVEKMLSEKKYRLENYNKTHRMLAKYLIYSYINNKKEMRKMFTGYDL